MRQKERRVVDDDENALAHRMHGTRARVWIVTGASGFVGAHVLAAIPDAVGLYRSREGRRIERWDRAHLRAALEGATGVVHAASIVHRPGALRDEYEQFNVEGTRALVEAARDANVRRFVFLSSIKIYGETPRGIIDEKTAVAPDAHYARTKAEAEKIVLAATDLRPIVLRLSPVYGRGDKGNVRTMIRAIRRRRFFVPGEGNIHKSIVHVSTVADVVRAAVANEASGVFVVADRATPTLRELADAIARALGRARPLSIPAPLLRRVARIVGSVARVARIATPISEALIDKAMTSTICDPSRVERELGVKCEVDLDWAIRDEIEWLREIRAL